VKQDKLYFCVRSDVKAEAGKVYGGKIRMEQNVGHGQRPALAQEYPCQDHTIPQRNCVLCKKKMFYINENIKMNKAYQSLPFLRSTLKSS
jgi:hypothetical protein